MPVFLGLLSFAFFTAGAWLTLGVVVTPRAPHDQVLVGIGLCFAFGGIMAGLAHISDCLDAMVPKSEPEPNPEPARTPKTWSEAQADRVLARYGRAPI